MIKNGEGTIIVRSKSDVFELVNSQVGSNRHGWLILLIALGGTFIDAYDFTSLSIGAVQLKTQFHLTAFQLGSLTAAMAVGALVAALIGGYYVDKIGRLKMFMLDLIFFVVSAVFAALAPNLIWLVLFRFLMGVGVGLDFPVALSFVAEFTNSRRRAMTVNIWQPMWFIATVLGLLAIIPFYYAGAGLNLWRWAVGLGALPAVIVLTLRFFYMRESPMWAASRGQLAEAVKVLRDTYGLNVELDNHAKITDEGALSASRAYGNLFSARYKLRTILAVVVNITESMEYFAVGFYLPTITLLLFGSHLIYALLGSVVFNLFGIIGGFLNVWRTSKWGIRNLLIIGYCGVIVALLAMGILKSLLPPLAASAFIALFIVSHSFGPGSMGMTIGTLSYPTQFRGAGSGLSQAAVRAGSILGFYFFPLVLAKVGLPLTLLMLAIVPAAGLITTLAIRWDPTHKDADREFAEENIAVNGGVTVPNLK